MWLRFGLNSNHTGDYQRSDCGHGGAGAAHDGGDVTWKYVNNGTNVEIDGGPVNGGRAHWRMWYPHWLGGRKGLIE